jgi:hypothetical protein
MALISNNTIDPLTPMTCTPSPLRNQTWHKGEIVFIQWDCIPKGLFFLNISCNSLRILTCSVLTCLELPIRSGPMRVSSNGCLPGFELCFLRTTPILLEMAPFLRQTLGQLCLVPNRLAANLLCSSLPSKEPRCTMVDCF